MIKEKLQTPIAWAEELKIELLLEPHGALTDTVEGMQSIVDALGHEDTIGIKLDTGNSWLGGGEPLEFIHRFGRRIRHVHWKDLGSEYAKERGKKFGCGMGTLPLGDGVVGIREIVTALKRIEFDGPTTLEVAGAENMKRSAERLQQWWSE
jgi:inosose dehydratase